MKTKKTSKTTKTTKTTKATKASEKAADDLPILPFADPTAWGRWLAKNHASSRGVWLKLAKKTTGIPSVTYAEAVEVALAWGWIDGQANRYDETAWLQRFTPRGTRSIWSMINREKATALIASGEMKPSGLAAVEAAKKDGRWDRAYESQSRSKVPDDLAAALAKNARAAAFFATINSVNRYAILFRIHGAKKPETRARRIATFVGMLSRRELIHP